MVVQYPRGRKITNSLKGSSVNKAHSSLRSLMAFHLILPFKFFLLWDPFRDISSISIFFPRHQLALLYFPPIHFLISSGGFLGKYENLISPYSLFSFFSKIPKNLTILYVYYLNEKHLRGHSKANFTNGSCYKRLNNYNKHTTFSDKGRL